MSDKIIIGKNFCLLRADDKDSMVNPSFWIADKDGERVSDIYYEGEYQKAKDEFNALEKRAKS